MNLGDIELETGNSKGAEETFTRALVAQQNVAPESTAVSAALSALAATARRAGDLEKAQALEEKALAMVVKLAPDSIDEARLAQELGLTPASATRFGRRLAKL